MSVARIRRVPLFLFVVMSPFVAALAFEIVMPDGVVSFARAGLVLPMTSFANSSVPAFEVKQQGGGIAGRFEITNPNSAAIALDGVHSGTGHALLAWNLGRGRGAVIITSNSANTLPALDVSSQSLGVVSSSTTTQGLAAAADIRANNINATTPALRVSHLGTGPVLQVDQRGTAGHLAEFKRAGVNKIHFTRAGKGVFNGGVSTGGADLAEAFEVEGHPRDYQPGDVMAVSVTSDERMERVSEAYSTRVAGVYATRPGVVLSDRDIDDTRDDTVAVGVVGVIPTKVSAENGPIRRGDLLVSAATPGHAMRADADKVRVGMVLGKALQNFAGPGTGSIKVLVNVK